MLRITPDNDTPLDAPSGVMGGLLDKVDAAVETVKFLGLPTPVPNSEEEQAAATLVAAFAANPAQTSKRATVQNVAQLTPPTLLLTQQILRDYAHSIVTSATQIRHLVTNKLIQETENPDPKVRIKALELLGKISDVGLFSEKTEVTITHQTTDDLRAKLKARLNALKDVTPADAEGYDNGDADNGPVMIEGEALDLDDILGADPETTCQMAQNPDKTTDVTPHTES